MSAVEERVVVIAGTDVRVRGDRSALLAGSRELLVGDLHLGRPESSQTRGLAVPAGPPREELDRLARALRACRATRLIVLGDLFHDPRALERSRCEELVTALLEAAQVPVELVPGNHDRIDRAALERLGLLMRPGGVWRGDLFLCHDADAAGEAPAIAGHLHPVATVSAPGERLRLPCFVVRERALLLPAFGRFTGGAVVRRSPGARRVAVLDGALIDLDASSR